MTDATIPTRASRRPLARGGRWLLIAVGLLLSLLVAVIAVWKYAGYDPSADTGDTVNFARHPLAIVFHAIGASCAPLVGLLQFSSRLRRRWPRLHRWMGRYYLVVCVALGGSAALWLSRFAYGGTIARVGLAMASAIWLVVSGVALVTIRRGDVVAHRRWMMRSLAMALGGVTLRIYLPLSMVSGVAFLTAYRFVAWGAWLPNLLIAEWIIRREARRASRV